MAIMTDEKRKLHSKLLAYKSSSEKFLSEIHSNYRSWLRFSLGEEQWSSDNAAKRQGRVTDTFNITQGYVYKALNPGLEAPAGINVYSSDPAQDELAQKLQGVFRRIQYESDFDSVTAKVRELTMRGGLGAWQVRVYEKDEPDGQETLVPSYEIVLELIQDPTQVLIDPLCRKADRSDARFQIRKAKMPSIEFARSWPHAQISQEILGKIGELGDDESSMDGEDEDRRELHSDDRGSDGVLDTEEVTYYEGWIKDGESVFCIYFTDDEILSEDHEYKGSFLPLILEMGPSFVSDDGKLKISCITELVKPPQQAYNWLLSEGLSQIATRPRIGTIAEDESIEGYETEWTDAAYKPVPVARYRKGGQVPQIPDQAPPPTGYMQLADMMITTANLITQQFPSDLQQAQSKIDTPSGEAIKQQRAASSISTYHYEVEHKSKLKLCGNIMLDLHTKYFNDDSVQVSLDSDNKPTLVSFGPGETEGAWNADLAGAKLGIIISSGPSIASQRDDLLDSMSQLTTNPQAAAILIPWIVRLKNIAGSEEIADQLQEVMWPPQVMQAWLKKHSGDPKSGELQQAMKQQAMQQTIDGLKGALKQTIAHIQELQQAEQAKQAEIQGKLQVEQAKGQVGLQQSRERNAADLQREQIRSETEIQRETIQTQGALDEAGIRIEGDKEIEAMRSTNELIALAHRITPETPPENPTIFQ